jgi:hypothetical protein
MHGVIPHSPIRLHGVVLSWAQGQLYLYLHLYFIRKYRIIVLSCPWDSAPYKFWTRWTSCYHFRSFQFPTTTKTNMVAVRTYKLWVTLAQLCVGSWNLAWLKVLEKCVTSVKVIVFGMWNSNVVAARILYLAFHLMEVTKEPFELCMRSFTWTRITNIR